MVSSVNTLDCWCFKEKEWIFLLCVACALVYWLKTCSVSLGFLVWFSVENYDYGLASSEFWCMGFTTSLGVKFLSLLFVSVVDMFRSSGLQCKLLRVGVFLPCFGRAPSCLLSWHCLHYHCCWKALHSRVFSITQNFKWKLVYVLVGHGLCSGILFTVF
jgi:hypothetical protein